MKPNVLLTGLMVLMANGVKITVYFTVQVNADMTRLFVK